MQKIVYSVAFLFIISFSFAHAETFNRTLMLGSQGTDVLQLQKILNSNPATSLAGTGPGSFGLETTNFRERTRQAVIKFQNLYADRILTPIGLTEGTGIVGQSTRDFLNTFEYTGPTGQELHFTGTSTIPTLQEILNMSTSTIPAGSEFLSPEELLNAYKNASSTYQGDTLFVGTSTQIYQGTNTPMTFSGFFPLVKASHPAKWAVIRSTRYGDEYGWVDKEFFIGSNSKISNLDFFLNNKKMYKNCRFGANGYLSEYGCELFIDKDTRPGVYTLSSSNPDLGTQKFTVVSRYTPYPVVNTRNFKVNENNRITGTGFTPKMKVFTIFGQYTVEAENNSFDLKIPSEFAKVFQTPTRGAFYVESASGLQSEMSSLISYEK